MKQAHIWCAVPTPGRFNSNQMQSFADILNGCGDGLAATIQDGWKVQQVLDAAMAAAKNTVKFMESLKIALTAGEEKEESGIDPIWQ